MNANEFVAPFAVSVLELLSVEMVLEAGDEKASKHKKTRAMILFIESIKRDAAPTGVARGFYTFFTTSASGVFSR